MTEFHDYIHRIARGPRSREDLDFDSAVDAMTQLLDGRATSSQAAALLVALRIKGETCEEFAGFVAAARAQLPSDGTSIDINWPCYSGKSRQPLWFLLAAKLLAQNGLTILLHDAPTASDTRCYTRQLIETLGIPQATSLSQAATQIGTQNIAWIGLETLSPALVELLGLRRQLGVRSIVNSLVRCLSPLPADVSVQSVFHPHYLTLHAEVAQRLGDEATLIFKGDGGEAEVRPYANSRLQLVTPLGDETAIIEKTCDKPTTTSPDAAALLDLWRDERANSCGHAAVIHTAAALLWATGRSPDIDVALQQANEYWKKRHPL